MFSLKTFLRNEVKPALGCTEPVAVALGAARAREELGSLAENVHMVVKVSPSIYKNGLDVGIPGAEGARGNLLAAALGYLRGNSSYGLEVLQDTDDQDFVKAHQMVEEGRVSLTCDYERTGVYVEVQIQQGSETALAVVEGSHSHISRVLRNGKESFAGKKSASSGVPTELEYRKALRNMEYYEVLGLVKYMDKDDQEWLLKGVAMNFAMGEAGLYGNVQSRLHLVKHLKALVESGKISQDLTSRIRLWATATSEARMSGVKKPVMSSAGSGNHGITAILPVALVGKDLGKTPEEIAQALCVSHLTTSYVKVRTGVLSPICGCAVAAGSGAAAGIAWLLGGTPEQVGGAVKLVLANLSGLVCDGAKESCALKVGTASCEAHLAALMALEGSVVEAPQGLVDPVMRVAVDDQGYFSTQGMKDTDRAIIQILETHVASRAGRV